MEERLVQFLSYGIFMLYLTQKTFQKEKKLIKNTYCEGNQIMQKPKRSTCTVPRWSHDTFLFHDRVRLVERLQVQLMNHIIAGENTTKYIHKDIRDDWKTKWNNVLRKMCNDLNDNKKEIITKNDIIYGLDLSGFQLESYINAGFSFSIFLNGLRAYTFYLRKGIEVCKLPRESYLYLERTNNMNDIDMPPLTFFDN